MTIIRNGVNKIGTAWSRKVNIETLANDGSMSVIHAMVIPPYVWPGYMWTNWKIIDDAATNSEMDAWKSAEANLFISMVELPDDIEPTSYDDHGELVTLANTYSPIDEIFLGADGSGDDEDVGFTGQDNTEVPDIFSRTLCKRYHYKMGIGKNAYPTNANKIRYHIEGKYEGHLKTKNMVDIAKPKLVLIRANTDIPQMVTTEDYAISGNVDLYTLYQTLVDNIPGRNTNATGTMDIENLNATLHSYLNKGLDGNGETQSDFFEAATMQVTNYVTTRLDIYEPAPRGHINPRNNP